MDRKIFLSALSQRLYPTLRDEGFRGSGNTLRQIAGPIIHVFNVQGSSGGARCYINLGVHLDFLPLRYGDVMEDPKKIPESGCLFRSRLDPPNEDAFGWPYGPSHADMNRCIERIREEWEKAGRAFFAPYSTWPESFRDIVDSTDPDDPTEHDLYHLGLIARELGDTERARTLLGSALDRQAEGSWLRRRIEAALATVAPD